MDLSNLNIEDEESRVDKIEASQGGTLILSPSLTSHLDDDDGDDDEEEDGQGGTPILSRSHFRMEISVLTQKQM